jgi:SAM-dependent methyltransferase
MSAYVDAINQDLLDRIPLDARVVLDVGCNTGALGAAYRRLNPRARVLGLEMDPGAAAIAARRLDSVVVGDIEVGPLPFAPQGGIDCISYGDVLEHLKDPWGVLERHAGSLSDEGTILICIPNIEHWLFAERLLRGVWDYEPKGLLDKGHLRWFSLETMRKGLAEAGLVACDVHARIFDGEKAAAFASAIAPGLRALGVDPQTYADRASPLQYVWRVRKKPHSMLMIGANMLAPVGGVSHLRVVYPMRAMFTDPSVVVRMASPLDVAAPESDTPRIFVLHRPAMTGPNATDLVRRLRTGGWLVVTEFDDHPDFFQSMQNEDQFSFRAVHAVQTSTPALAEILSLRNPEVRVFPNAIRALPEPRNFADPNVITLFFGALNREPDWRPLMPTLNAVAAAVGDRLRFAVVHDRGFFDALETSHKSFTPTCDHDTYMSLLGQCEISFMPLGDTWFNRAKSDLKFIEAGACRVAALASHVVYGGSIEDGRTGLLFRDAEELRTRLLRLIAIPDTARGLGDAARGYVAAERMLAYQVAPRIAWYRSLWERREELEQARVARMAERGAVA